MKATAHSHFWRKGLEKTLEQWEVLSILPNQSVQSCSSTSASLGMARHTMETHSCWLYRTLPWTHVLLCCGCSFKVDNGPQFISAEFSKSNRIKHILSAPYCLATNGLAKRFVQTLKRNLKAGEKEGKTLHHRLAEFLFEDRATPHATTNVLPSQLFLKWKLWTHFDLMMPSTKDHVMFKQAEHYSMTGLLSLDLCFQASSVG